MFCRSCGCTDIDTSGDEIDGIRTVKQFFEYLRDKDQLDICDEDIDLTQAAGVSVRLGNAWIITQDDERLDKVRLRLLKQYNEIFGIE